MTTTRLREQDQPRLDDGARRSLLNYRLQLQAELAEVERMLATPIGEGRRPQTFGLES